MVFIGMTAVMTDSAIVVVTCAVTTSATIVAAIIVGQRRAGRMVHVANRACFLWQGGAPSIQTTILLRIDLPSLRPRHPSSQGYCCSRYLLPQSYSAFVFWLCCCSNGLPGRSQFASLADQEPSSSSLCFSPRGDGAAVFVR